MEFLPAREILGMDEAIVEEQAFTRQLKLEAGSNWAGTEAACQAWTIRITEQYGAWVLTQYTPTQCALIEMHDRLFVREMELPCLQLT